MTRPIRVLRVISHLGSGGTERQCVEVLHEMWAHRAELGLEIELATYWNRGHLHTPPPGMPWHRVDAPGSPYGALRATAALATLLRRNAYDCVHALLWPSAALVAPMLPRRTSLLTSIHSSEIRARAGKAAALRVIGARTDLLVFNSRAGAQRLRERFGVLNARTRVQPNGKRLLPPPTFDGRSGIVCVARDVPSKRQDLLLAAWVRLPQASRPPLTFIGRGTDRGPLGDAIHRAGARGLGEVEDPTPFTRTAAVAALPTDHEGMPNAILEAWNAGAAVLASRVPGVIELVHEGRDARCVANDVAAWVEALDELLRDAARRRALATAGRERLETEFSHLRGHAVHG